MGAGIAHALLLAGSSVIVAEAGPEAGEAARHRVTAAVQASSERGLLSESVEDLLNRLSVAHSIEALSACGLVIEAVPEDLALKIDVVRAIEAVVLADAVIATNTSSLPVVDIASASAHPERVIGLHFFNPVPASALVEIVVAEQTAPDLVDAARGWVVALGKTPIVVRDSPGFASSRLGVVLGLEAIRMVEEGVASADDIDAAMTLGYRHPVGPLRLTDIVGLDVRLDIARHLEATLGPRFSPPALLVGKVNRGELGRKSGQGFYAWDES